MIDTILDALTGLINGDYIEENDIGDKLYGMEITTATNVLWALAKNADDDIPDVREWLDQFDVFPLADIIPEVMDVLVKSMVSTKKAQLLQERLQAIALQFIQSQSQPQTEA